MTIAGELATFLTHTETADLPAQALQHAEMIVASTLASAAYGTGLQSARIIRDLAREQGGRPDASLWFDNGPRLPFAEAARANAMLSDAAASDDSDLRNIVHCGTQLTAASLALAEHLGSSGKEIARAIVLGYEAAGRISEAITPGYSVRGFHGSVGAVFAAAVAAASMLALNAEQMAQTIAIAATSIGGLYTAADTSVAREYHAGLASLLGVNAARAAKRDLVAKENILEARRGFFEAFAGVDGAAGGAVVTRGLGDAWDIVTDMAIKLVPGGHPYHAFGEAAANASREANVSAEEVASITISRPNFMALSGPLHPANLIDMAHSPAYFTAAGVADRSFSWMHASDAKITDPVIHGLIDKVRVGAPPTEHAERYRQGATVVIRTQDGRTFENTVFVPKGAGMLGIDWNDIAAKYHALMPASGLSSDKIEQSLGLIRDLRSLDTIRPLIALLRVDG